MSSRKPRRAPEPGARVSDHLGLRVALQATPQSFKDDLDFCVQGLWRMAAGRAHSCTLDRDSLAALRATLGHALRIVSDATIVDRPEVLARFEAEAAAASDAPLQRFLATVATPRPGTRAP